MHRFLSDIELASLALASVVLLVAGLLGYREWLDRLARSSSLAAEDRDHYQRRDRRRSVGLSILCFLALGVVVGSRVPIRQGIHANPWFLGIWLVIFGLIFVLLGLALVDWLDLKRYARQKKSAIGREHLTIIQAQIDRWKDEDATEDHDEDGSSGTGR